MEAAKNIHQLFIEMHECTRKIYEQLQEDHYEDMNNFLQLRQQLMDQTDQILTTNPDYQHSVEIGKVIEKIREMDRYITGKCESKRKELGSKLENISVGKMQKQKYKGYGNQAAGFFFDKKK